MKNIIVSAENVSVQFDTTTVLENISFNINENDVFVILGPNGAGKTTLLRALLDLIPYQGKISWNTQSVGYVPPQEECLRKGLPPLTVREFFGLGRCRSMKPFDRLRANGWRKRLPLILSDFFLKIVSKEERTSKKNKTTDTEIATLIKEVGLEEKILDQQYSSLSTGQFQRMLFAWALVGNPSVLILDEPTSGVDVAGESTIYALLHDLWKKRNLTIILITHDLNVVWGHASKVLCLNKTKLCEGDPQKVLTPDELHNLYGENIKFYQHKHCKGEK
jgi:ABC-type Mn2+/Zn2+ transport system ATPase subunit